MNLNRKYEWSISVFRWNTLIARESRQNPKNSLGIYKQMQESSVSPNRFTFPSLFKACAALRVIVNCKQIHAHIIRHGLQSDKFINASIIDSYGKCQNPGDARKKFDEISPEDIDLVSWTALTTSYSLNGLGKKAFETFVLMNRWVFEVNCDYYLDAVILSTLVSSCMFDVLLGKMIHTLVIKYGFESNVRLMNTFIQMYFRCEVVTDAVQMFDEIPDREKDVISWNTMISGLTMNGEPDLGLEMFDRMLSNQSNKVPPNRITLISLCNSCAELGCFDTSRRIHEYLVSYHSSLLSPRDTEMSTAHLDMLSRCGNLGLAREIFDGIEEKNVVCWSAMISGYEHASFPEEALHLFRLMLEEESEEPNAITMVSVISACSDIGSSRSGKVIHKYVIVSGTDNDSRVTAALIDMYAKCGDIDSARKVFEFVPNGNKNVIMWSSIISAEGWHGHGRQALRLFKEMREMGVIPNSITFISILSSCSHSGLVPEGLSCFASMESDYSISPNVKHYACMVDLLGRSGQLSEAYDLISNMPIEADAAVWGSLLGACRLHHNVELSKVAEDKILSLCPDSVGHRVLLANIYSAIGHDEEASRVRTELRRKRLMKNAGKSFVEIANMVYGFISNDRMHPNSESIYRELGLLDEKVKKAGFEEDEDVDGSVVRESSSKYHSERLAMAFGLMTMKKERIVGPLYITKNLRVCKNCHCYTKFVSKVCQIELIVRDAHRFHHFKDGYCSCGDYW